MMILFSSEFLEKGDEMKMEYEIVSDERDTSNSVRLCTLWPQLPPNRRKKWRRNWKPYNQSTGAIEWFSNPTLPISTSISNLAPPMLLHNRKSGKI
ncbi:hypothetical protein D8674_037927 [Pyrus ussuriensis x Pyrus communis]|uniref:Uncharacterized protein n=1 Tax=Pyrus ussuriensis x Pyrus communis TaxID=2448454 RepID=A0A5N5FLW2_9ROSA|nr:hypothetical protein D8674_037927 [Pyrus ussuriensis x Pyrus communis]